MPLQPCLTELDTSTEGAVLPSAAPRAPRTEPSERAERSEPSDAPPPAPPAPSAPLYRERLHRIARASRLPLAVYAAVLLLLHLAILAVMNPPDGPGVRDRLLAWDAQWFVDIARNGYPQDFAFTADGLSGGTLAFFPAYPFLVRVVHTLTGLGYEAAALVTSHLALLAALICVHRLLLRLYDRRTAHIATLLVACAQPMALVFFMAYSESLLLALAAGALLAIHRPG